MKVSLLRYTVNPDYSVALAAKVCYSNSCISDTTVELGLETLELIDKIIKSGHLSVLEHVSFTFGIEDISRACSHQLVRHRIASYSQKSQRYTADKGNMVLPQSILDNSEMYKKVYHLFDDINTIYNELIGSGIPKEDARYVLPNASTTTIVATFNARSLFNFFELRCCNRAQWEIRELAWKMLGLVLEVSPKVFLHAGPRCINGKCKEEYPCGKPYTKEQIEKIYLR